MPLTIGANIASLRTQRKLGESTEALSRTYEKLSSGLRINRASDDAAGLAIATSLNSDARIFSQAIRNVNDGVSVLNIAESATQQLTSILQRQKELATQASNGSYGTSQRAALQNESNQLTSEFNRIVATTSFNRRTLLDGSISQLQLQVGTGSNSTSTIALDFSVMFGSTTTSSAGVATAASGTAESNSFDFGSVMQGASINISTDTWDQFIGFSPYSKFYVMNGGVEEAYYLYYSLNGSGVDPLVGGTALPVYFSTGASQEEIANAVEAQLNTIPGISISRGGDNFIVTNLEAGSVSDVEGSRISLISNGVTLQDGDNFSFSTPSTNYYVWFTSSGAGNPNYAGRTGIRVDFTSGMSSQDVLTETINQIQLAGTGATISQTGSPFALGLSIQNSVNGAVTAPSVSISSGLMSATRDTIGTATAFNPGADTITLASHGYTTAQALTISSTGALPGGLSAGTYYAIIVNGNTIKLASSIANANAGTAINITGYGTGTMTLTAPGATTTTTSTPYISNLDISSQAAARSSLTTIDSQMQLVSTMQGTIGASQSRLATVLNSLSAARENNIIAASRIMNADIASESAELVRRQILQQASTAVLAQANQQPALALLLLK